MANLELHNVGDILDLTVGSPAVVFVIALLLAAPALARKVSMDAAQLLVMAAFIVSVCALRDLPYPAWICLSLVIGGFFALMAFWLRPDLIPGHTGHLERDAIRLNRGFPTRGVI
jgi:hypothetical protein